MSIIKVFHGSDHIIHKPLYQGGKKDNDYGNGFYTTEYPERAESWAALNGSTERSVVNEYELDLTGLAIKDMLFRELPHGMRFKILCSITGREITMSREAYDEAYLDSMILKIRYLFKLIARNAENPFSVIRTYMKCDYRRKMDLGNPLFLNKTLFFSGNCG